MMTDVIEHPELWLLRGRCRGLDKAEAPSAAPHTKILGVALCDWTDARQTVRPDAHDADRAMYAQCYLVYVQFGIYIPAYQKSCIHGNCKTRPQPNTIQQNQLVTAARTTIEATSIDTTTTTTTPPLTPSSPSSPPKSPSTPESSP